MAHRLLLAVLCISAVSLPSAQQPAAQWWAHVVFLAGDEMKGRDTGSPEHRKAAEYVADQFKRAGLEPGGTKGRVRAERPVQLHQEGRAGAVVEGGLHEGFTGAPAGEALAHRALPRAQ